MTSSKAREGPLISMRFSAAELDVIDRAARLWGRSRTQFVRDAAVRAAEVTLLERRIICLRSGGFADFLTILSEPAEPVAEMVELARRPAPWEGAGSPRR